MFCFSLLPSLEINATGFNYQNEDEKVTLSFPSALQKGERGLRVAPPPVEATTHLFFRCCR